MINIIDEKNCCGCGACKAACPKQCISMKEGTLGHLFPEVDKDLCVECGKCESVCPMLKQFEEKDTEQEVYAAYANDKGIREAGASGGMFEIFANALLEKGCVVYGAAFDGELKLKCETAKSKEELGKLKKSKYLQCDINGKYEEIESRLKSGEKVFYISTPCQVSALKLFLNKDYDNLFTVDFFCHGVPSQNFFDTCIRLDEKEKYQGTVNNYKFRTKIKKGSTPHYYTVTYWKKGKQKSKTDYYFDSTFYAFFQQYICLRESCYDCRYASNNKTSDITVGDFHDIDNYVSGINRFDGVSTVVINTEKGKKLFEEIRSEIYHERIDDKENLVSREGTRRPKNRDAFLEDYRKMDISALAKKYVSPKRYLKNRIYYSMPKFIRSFLMKVIGEK